MCGVASGVPASRRIYATNCRTIQQVTRRLFNAVPSDPWHVSSRPPGGASSAQPNDTKQPTLGKNATSIVT
jgi:hypothetical protein